MTSGLDRLTQALGQPDTIRTSLSCAHCWDARSKEDVETARAIYPKIVISDRLDSKWDISYVEWRNDGSCQADHR